MQKTLAEKVVIQGIGLHSGKVCRLELVPARPDYGVVFQRCGEEPHSPMFHDLFIDAHIDNVGETTLSTCLRRGTVSVGTVEHLMAALMGLKIDNVLVKVFGDEIPILDGSSRPFVQAILDAGITVQHVPRQLYRFKKAFELSVGDKTLRIDPSRKQRYSVAIDFGKDTLIGRQNMDFTLTEDSFRELSMARTFCQVKEVEAMRRSGLALGGSLDNAIVVDGKKILNPEGLRAPNEFVQHKVLDLIGDFSLLGKAFLGRVSTYKGGHALHAEAMRQIMQKKFEYLEVVYQPPLADEVDETTIEDSFSEAFAPLRVW